MHCAHDVVPRNKNCDVVIVGLASQPGLFVRERVNLGGSRAMLMDPALIRCEPIAGGLGWAWPWANNGYMDHRLRLVERVRTRVFEFETDCASSATRWMWTSVGLVSSGLGHRGSKVSLHSRRIDAGTQRPTSTEHRYTFDGSSASQCAHMYTDPPTPRRLERGARGEQGGWKGVRNVKWCL